MKNFLVSLILLLPIVVKAQFPLIPASLEDRIKRSELVFEGIVTGQTAIRSSKVNRILTINTIKVLRSYKGGSDTKIKLVTQGGTIDNEMMTCAELATLRLNEHAVFFAIPSTNAPGDDRYDIYTEKQGVLRVTENDFLADLFLGKIERKVFEEKVKAATGNSYKSFADPEKNKSRSSLIPIISSFSPLTLTAGTNTQLTITGSGFGNSKGQGSVQFKNADDGGNSFIEPFDVQYKSWSDTKIIVEVPTEAGTGKIRVSTGSLFATSSADLTIRFARAQVEYEGNVYSPILVDEMAGGYAWRMFRGFENDSVPRNSFLRAFNRWRCTSGVNWFIGSTTDIDITERDNLSIIRFDNADELPANVLGVCYSYYQACTAGEWYVSEYDIIFDREANWEFGPALPSANEYDFESVAFHELGHGHQLTHVINSADVMHYAISDEEAQREPNADDIDGAKLVIGQSNRNICGYGPMRTVTQDICNDPYFAYFNNEPPLVYPIPVTGVLNISYFLAEDNDLIDISLIDITGKKVVQFIRSPQKKGEHTITQDMSRYNLGKGVYILKSRINNTDYTRKIISVM